MSNSLGFTDVERAELTARINKESEELEIARANGSSDFTLRYFQGLIDMDVLFLHVDEEMKAIEARRQVLAESCLTKLASARGWM